MQCPRGMPFIAPLGGSRSSSASRVAVETPHPRASAGRLVERLDGRRLESVEAVGKNLLLSFEGGFVLRSHLRINGRWQVRARGSKALVGKPWLVLQATEHEAVLWNGPVLELTRRALGRLGPDILADPPDLARMVDNFRREHPSRQLGDALLDQRLVAGIGNVWRAEALWRAGVSPWEAIGEVDDTALKRVLTEAVRLMQGSLEGAREKRAVYRRVGRPCPRCGTAIRSRGQGDANRIAYWCPRCQRGEEPPAA
jgi:endonuclease VIII